MWRKTKVMLLIFKYYLNILLCYCKLIILTREVHGNIWFRSSINVLSQIEATRREIRPLLLSSRPRPLVARERERTPEPPVRGERHPAEDGRVHPRRQNHLRAQQTDTWRHEAARKGLTRYGAKVNPARDARVAKSWVDPSIMTLRNLNWSLQCK